MTTMTVFLVCLGGIAACAALIFAVETLVAFGLHRQSSAEQVQEIEYRLPVPITRHRQFEEAEEAVHDRAA